MSQNRAYSAVPDTFEAIVYDLLVETYGPSKVPSVQWVTDRIHGGHIVATFEEVTVMPDAWTQP